MSLEESDIYSSVNIVKKEKEFQDIFNEWKQKNNIIKGNNSFNNELIDLENEFNTHFIEWKKKIKKKKNNLHCYYR